MTQTPRTGTSAGLPERAVEVKPTLETELSLRPLEASDRSGFIGMIERSRPSVGRWLPLNEAGETDDAFFERQLRLCAEGDRSRSSVRRVGVLGDGRLAGMFCLNSVSRGLSWEADAIWWIDETLRGRGLATRGVRALLDLAFADLPSGLGLHGVHCGIEEGNDASVRVAQKCGFAHQPGKRSHLKVGEQWAMHEFYLATPESLSAARDAA
jgi:RimJ/RimL family protein N-acetyltransferase